MSLKHSVPTDDNDLINLENQQMDATQGLLELKAEHYWQTLQSNEQFTLKYSHLEGQIKPILGLSDFVAESIMSEPDLIDWLVVGDGLSQSSDDYRLLLERELVNASSEGQLQTILRKFRRKHMTKIAWKDLLNLQSIERSIAVVSNLADCMTIGAYQWLYDDACKRYGIPQGKHGPQDMLILGMGKLGGKELNFSSDIDLIFTYPSNSVTSGGKKSIEHNQFFTRLAQKLIATLNNLTVNGRVFRVDMRLRPFGESGPLVSQFAAFEDYYQDQGREWERYAMIKARILNPPSPYVKELQNILNPFIYRRYLDFSAIQSLRDMKSMISREVRRRGLKNNIKLGSGGIREVEFIVQSFQLIRGGQEPSLQKASLLFSLNSLVKLDIFKQSEASLLLQNYFYLRKVEHCLQQFGDKQTQFLPDDDLDKTRLTKIMNETTYDDFVTTLRTHMNNVNYQFETLIGSDDEQEQQSQLKHHNEMSDLWLLDLSDSEAKFLLTPILLNASSSQFINSVFEFKKLTEKKPIGNRGQDTLKQLIPTILSIVVEQYFEAINTVLARVLAVLESIIGRTTYLQLLNENLGATEQLIRLCAASPWISAQIKRFPMLLDELLNPVHLYNPPALDSYSSDLRQSMLRVEPDDLELQMEVLRQFKLSEQLRIAAADVTNILPIMRVSDHLTFLAQAIIDEVLSIAWQQMEEKYGCPKDTSVSNTGFAVIGYGKLGGFELGYGSDLDLVFIHNATNGSFTNGKKPIESASFYTKLAQRIMHIFSTKTTLGELYEVDMRLRPSGNAGLLVCHHQGFLHYQKNDAWTWEHQALVRARFVAGDQNLATIFSDIRKAILIHPRDIKVLAIEVAEMREKMRAHLSISEVDGFDIKQDHGGIADIEFMVQFWVLAFSEKYPELTKWSDNIRIMESLAACEILSKPTVTVLSNAYLTYRNTTHNLALQESKVVEKHAVFHSTIEQVRRIWKHTLERT
jgi:glutamate-ammonia-ligase adenylyltransferase